MLALDSHSTFCFNLFPNRHFWTAHVVQRSKGAPVLRDRRYETPRGPRLPKLRPNPASLHRPSSPLRARPPHPTGTNTATPTPNTPRPPKWRRLPHTPKMAAPPSGWGATVGAPPWGHVTSATPASHVVPPAGARDEAASSPPPPAPAGRSREPRNGAAPVPGAFPPHPAPGDRGDGATHAPGVVVGKEQSVLGGVGLCWDFWGKSEQKH